ncbi:MAG TPA: hypothetical protein DEP84_30475 [Chloroflexi bacterium]|nr:hypothetical protein [Chloroflexota bacterium]
MTGGFTVTMTGWTLRDNAGPTYTFPQSTLNPAASVRLWTKAGTNTGTDLSWGRSWSQGGNDQF